MLLKCEVWCQCCMFSKSLWLFVWILMEFDDFWKDVCICNRCVVMRLYFFWAEVIWTCRLWMRGGEKFWWKSYINCERFWKLWILSTWCENYMSFETWEVSENVGRRCLSLYTSLWEIEMMNVNDCWYIVLRNTLKVYITKWAKRQYNKI